MSFVKLLILSETISLTFALPEFLVPTSLSMLRWNVPYPYNFPSAYPASLCTDPPPLRKKERGGGEGYVYRLYPVCHLS